MIVKFLKFYIKELMHRKSGQERIGLDGKQLFIYYDYAAGMIKKIQVQVKYTKLIERVVLYALNVGYF